MAGKYNTWLRRTLANRIRQNGGYNSRSDGAPLAWTVRYYRGLESVEEAAKMLAETHFINELDMLVQMPDIDEKLAIFFDTLALSSARWSHAQGCLVDDLYEDEGIRTWSPKTATRYGFDYKGEGADRAFDMELKNYGRGGKHVCLTRFDGEQLDRVTNEELADLIDPSIEKNPSYDTLLPNGWCRKLMGIMDELDETLTDENAERCGRYYETDWLARELGLFD